MRKIFFIILSLLSFCGYAQNPFNDLSQQFQDPQFLALINNYFGCKTWKDGNCIQCSNRFYFNEKGVCCQVKPNCQKFNTLMGSCQKCYQGFQLIDQQCIATDLTLDKNRGCRIWEGSECKECSFKFVFNQNKECEQIDDLCSEWNENTGQCFLCYRGYVIEGGKCVVDTFRADLNDNLCKRWRDRVCLECAQRAFFDQNGKCQEVNTNCQTWDRFDGKCLSCYKGFQLNGSQCIVSQIFNSLPIDTGCAQWDWDSQICLKCSFRFFQAINGSCIPISDTCKQYEEDGTCKQCYRGFQLQNNKCVEFQPELKDENCAEWDWQFQLCLACERGAYFDKDGRCIEKSPLCKLINANGQCIQCYKGYTLERNECILNDSFENADKLCAEWNWDDQICLKCAQRAVLKENGKCVAVSDFCKTFNDEGNCESCYKGYKLNNGKCILDVKITSPPDLGCAEWDWQNLICLKCSHRFYFDEFGFCSEIDGNCKDFDDLGQCLDCYKGYQLLNGKCQLIEIIQPYDLLCADWDWDSQICLRCSNRAYFNQNGKCVAISDFCRTFDERGECLSCFKGYQLLNGNCEVDLAFNFEPPSDLGCSDWDWDNQICLKCSFRWFFNESGKCEKVSDLCQTFDEKGNCLSCYSGFKVQEGECVKTDLLCKQFDADFNCKSCYTGYVLLKGSCQPLSKLADIVLYYMECCPEKLESLKKQGRLP